MTGKRQTVYGSWQLRFSIKVFVTPTCHWWTGGKCPRGYGKFKLDGKTEQAHRVAFLLHHGHWPVNQCLHTCDNKSCVNPLHLYDGTHQQNMDDSKARSHPGAPVGNQNARKR